MNRFTRRSISLVLLIYGLFSCAEVLLPVTTTVSKPVKMQEHRFNAGRKGEGHIYWTSVIMANGSYLWTQRTADFFMSADSIDLALSALGGSVVRYRAHGRSTSQWEPVDAADEKYRPFPFVVALLGLLYLYPKWSPEGGLFIWAVQLLCAGAWAMVQLATGGYLFKLQLLLAR